MTLSELKARTAARKAAGENQHYPRHAKPAATPKPVPPPPPVGTCPHLGAPTGERAECQTCRGKVELTVFACAVHGSCTAGRKVEGRACCVGCPDGVAARPPLPSP